MVIFDKYDLLKWIFSHFGLLMRRRLKKLMKNSLLLTVIPGLSKTNFIGFSLDKGKSNSPNALALLPDGSIISASLDRIIIFYYSSDYKLTKVIKELNFVLCLLLYEGGNIASGLVGGAISVRGVDGTSIAVLRGHRDSVSCLLYGGKNLISGSKDNTIRVWSTDLDECICVLKGHDDQITCMLLLGGRGFVTGSDDTTLRLWHKGKCTHILEEHQDIVSCLLLLPNKHFASGSYDHTINIWDSRRMSLICTLTGHQDAITSMIIHENHITSASVSGTLMFWYGVSDYKGLLFDKFIRMFRERRYEYKCLGSLDSTRGEGDIMCSLLSLKDGAFVSESADGILTVLRFIDIND
jgi:WD40 repeat protein